MKKILIVGLCIVGFMTLKAQTSQILPVNEKTGKVTFMEVVESPGMTATEIFQVLRDWAKSKNFVSTSTEGTKAEYNGGINVSYRDFRKTGYDDGKVKFVIHLRAKEGRFQFIFTDFVHVSKVCGGGELAPVKPTCPTSRMSLAGWTEIKKATRTKINVMVAEIKKAVKESQNDPTKNDDW